MSSQRIVESLRDKAIDGQWLRLQHRGVFGRWQPALHAFFNPCASGLLVVEGHPSNNPAEVERALAANWLQENRCVGAFG